MRLITRVPQVFKANTLVRATRERTTQIGETMFVREGRKTWAFDADTIPRLFHAARVGQLHHRGHRGSQRTRRRTGLPPTIATMAPDADGLTKRRDAVSAGVTSGVWRLMVWRGFCHVFLGSHMRWTKL